MKYAVGAVSNRTGRVLSLSEDAHNDLDSVLNEWEILNGSLDGMEAPGFRWAVFSLSEVDVKDLFRHKMVTPIYSVGDRVTIKGVITEIVDIRVIPGETTYGVEFHNGDYSVVTAKDIEGKINV